MGIGAFVYSLPHFISNQFNHSSNETASHATLCVQNSFEVAVEPVSPSGASNVFPAFVIGQILHGIGASPILSLGKYNTLHKYTQYLVCLLGLDIIISYYVYVPPT